MKVSRWSFALAVAIAPTACSTGEGPDTSPTGPRRPGHDQSVRSVERTHDVGGEVGHDLGDATGPLGAGNIAGSSISIFGGVLNPNSTLAQAKLQAIQEVRHLKAITLPSDALVGQGDPKAAERAFQQSFAAKLENPDEVIVLHHRYGDYLFGRGKFAAAMRQVSSADTKLKEMYGDVHPYRSEIIKSMKAVFFELDNFRAAAGIRRFLIASF